MSARDNVITEAVMSGNLIDPQNMTDAQVVEMLEIIGPKRVAEWLDHKPADIAYHHYAVIRKHDGCQACVHRASKAMTAAEWDRWAPCNKCHRQSKFEPKPTEEAANPEE